MSAFIISLRSQTTEWRHLAILNYGIPGGAGGTPCLQSGTNASNPKAAAETSHDGMQNFPPEPR